MQAWKTDPHWFIRVDRGEEIVSSLTKFSTEQSITAGSIRGIGGVGPATLAFYKLDTKSYDTKIFTEEYELLSLLGNFSIYNQKPFVHIHAVLGDDKFQAFGGHVMEMTVALSVEIIVLTDNYQMDRYEDSTLGLKPWSSCKICEI